MIKFRHIAGLLSLLTLISATIIQDRKPNKVAHMEPEGITLVVLGTVQDAGSPQAGCTKDCCSNIKSKRSVVSLGIIDHDSGKRWIFDATPDFTSQLAMLNTGKENLSSPAPDGIFLTHALYGSHLFGERSYGSKGSSSICYA